MKFLISAIIPTWNRAERLCRCLKSLGNQRRCELEIVVADDGSDGNEAEAIQVIAPAALFVGGGARLGHPYRRNEAILASHGEYLLHLDDDIEFENDGALAAMAAALENGPDLGAVGGEIPVHAGVRDLVAGLNVSAGWYTRQVTVGREGGAVNCASLASLNFMTRREDTFRVGGYDPYYEFGMPDLDFCLGIRKLGLGCAIKYEWGALHWASQAGRRRDVTLRYCRNRVRTIIKHAGVVRALMQWGWDMALLARVAAVKRAGREISDLQEDGLKFIPRAYAYNFANVREVLWARGRNFLAKEEMQRFREFKAGESESGDAGGSAGRESGGRR